MAIPQSPAIEFIDVSVRFTTNTGTRGIQHVTASVPHGKSIALIGPSGSGKSTLLSLCNLFLTAQSGTVKVTGRDVLEWDVPTLRRTVGMVFQTPVMFPGTVMDNLKMGCELSGSRMRQMSELETWLDAVDLERDVLTQNAQDLSGGQKQRLSLVRTILNQPQILLLDEVTSALDAGSTGRVEQLVGDVRKKHECTVLWVTHNLEQARRVSDETWLLVDGQLVEAAETQAFFEQPKTEAAQKFLASGGKEETEA